MSYSESNGQVILTMSREDYQTLLMALGAAHSLHLMGDTETMLAFVDRLNSGNPDYTPYQVEKP
jgi:hypothetical protein